MLNQLEYELKRQKTMLKEAFLKFFVQIVGDYRQFIDQEAKSFDRESFIAQKPPDLQNVRLLFLFPSFPLYLSFDLDRDLFGETRRKKTKEKKERK